MRIKVPWKNLATEQTLIELDGVYVIVVPYLSMFSLFIIHLQKNADFVTCARGVMSSLALLVC